MTGIIGLSINASGEKSIIPEWIKNNAKWWSEGTITEADYISGLQYLITQGVIKIPIKEVTATDTPLSDNDRAQSFVVRIQMEKELTFYTFSRIAQIGQTIGEDSGSNTPQSFYGGPQFELESIPSKDKKPFYELVTKYQKGPKPQPFTVNIDIIAGDGSVIETLNYEKCEISAYWVFSDDNEQSYRFAKNDGIEIRDATDFLCTGYHTMTHP